LSTGFENPVETQKGLDNGDPPVAQIQFLVLIQVDEAVVDLKGSRMGLGSTAHGGLYLEIQSSAVAIFRC
jgi:hypothetical protein